MCIHKLLTLLVLSSFASCWSSPATAQSTTVFQSLAKSDETLSKGHFTFARTLFSRDLLTPPDNLPADTTFTLSKEDAVIKSEVEVVYVGDRFVRRMVDKKSGSEIRESFDGTYFCSLTTPSLSDVGTKPSLVVERRGTLLNGVIYANARAFTVYPGPMLFQGRGISLIHPDIVVRDSKASFPFAGLQATVVFDPAHDYVAKSMRLTRLDGKCVTEMMMTKPARLKSGVWVASDSTHLGYDDKGKVNSETHVTLLAGKDGQDVASLYPED